jgi:hypothetical protein
MLFACHSLLVWTTMPGGSQTVFSWNTGCDAFPLVRALPACYAIDRFAPTARGTIETRIAVGNSVFRELLNFISNFPVSAVGDVCGIFEWSVHAIASVSGTNMPGAALWMRLLAPASKNF